MAEDLTEYYADLGIRVKYLHSDIDTLDRVEIIGSFALENLMSWLASIS